MARPRKWRKVCCMPKSGRFGPLDESVNEVDAITMTIDEYETIRLIDMESFTQEQCSEQMNIARTTVQGIYNMARKKLAEVLVQGKSLVIAGGDYRLCEGLEKSCRCGGCERHRCEADHKKKLRKEGSPCE
ncbi:MAG: DUF134 domain-containing protein [Selenomonadaceae bacterium]